MSAEEMRDEIERVAIVGMACRFPGAADVNEYWRNLRDGVESITAFGEEELLAHGVTPEALKAPGYVRARGVLANPEWFDASFFGFSPREAEIIDPQIRLFLENSWEALENAGYNSETYGGIIGIYGGMSAGQYILYNLLPDRELVSAVGAVQLRLLNDKDFLTPLVAYKLNLTGPTVNVQTACSTSLVAVHLACQSLLSYQCDIVLAGGVSVNVPTKSGYVPVEGVFSPDGHCRAFDAGAQGTVSGSGVGAVALKRLSDALADGDTIHAVIRGSAINNDGALRVGYSAPSVDGQAEVIAMAQAVAGVEAESITYVETHGTGTPMGDPIEVAALTQVFAAKTERKNFCALGSVKTNIGHADAAAGMASLIKTVMALKHRELPPSLNFTRPNPEIDFEDSPFYVNDRLRPWETGGAPARAGVSSFAMGGTNAHLVVEQAPRAEATAPGRPWQLVLLSAKTESALEAATDNLAAYLKGRGEPAPADAAYTLAVGRREFKHRRAVVCRDADDLTSALEKRSPRRVLTAAAGSPKRPVIFMFPGLGNHYVNMGLELYRLEPAFREQVDLCCELLRPHTGADLRDVMFPDWRRDAGAGAPEKASAGAGLDLRRMLRGGGDAPDEAAQRLNQTVFAQPALFVIEYALAKLWENWGVEPDALIGYSIGEYTAACLAGVFSLEDALMLVAHRARLIQELPGGAMLAVPLPASEVRALLGDQLDLSAVSGPSVCVVAGPTEAVDELESALAQKGVAVRRLPTTHAFHTRMIEPIVEPFTAKFKGVRLSPPSKRVISNVTGDWLTAEQATDPRYWATHLCRPVLFEAGLARLWREKEPVLLEVGPGQALGAWALQHPQSAQAADPVVLSSLRHSYDEQSDQAFLLNTLGRIWLAGVTPDWAAFYGDGRRRVPLPTYPFERERYWVEPRKPVRDADAGAASGPLTKKGELAEWFYLPSWKQSKPQPAFASEALKGRGKPYLVFADECGLGARLAERLAAAGQEVVTVRAGEAFQKVDGRAFVINPRRGGDYEALLGELRALELLPQSVCHLWGLTPEEPEGADLAGADDLQFKGFYSLLFLAQALGNRNLTAPLRLFVVTSGVQSVSGDEALCPAKATVLGPCRVIPQEYPHITCQTVDVVAPDARRADALAEQLLSELAAEPADTAETPVAYRGRRRWVQTFEPLRLGGDGGGATRLREGGVYLITGGLGGIGLTLADYLARTARARLVLTGRSELPPRDEWEARLAARDTGDTLASKMRQVLLLEEAGAEVLVARADVTSAEEMRGVLEAARARFGRIDGVVHAAGVMPGGMMQLKQPDVAAAVLAPKLKGALVLDSLLAGEELDFFICCSSLNAIYGGFGLVDHCGANAFLDAFAEARAARGHASTLSVNWDGWLEVGQAAHAAVSAGLQGILSATREDEIEAGGDEAHPLLDRLVLDEPEREVHAAFISTARHWMVDEHRLMGNGVVPGTGYLEMVRAAFEKRAGGGTIEMHKVFFMTPLTVRDGEVKEARITFTKNKDAYDFTVASRQGSASEPLWQEHVRGKITHAGPAPARPRPLAEMLSRLAPQELDSAEATRKGRQEAAPGEGGFRESDRNFGPRWQNLLRRVGLTADEALAYLELPEAFAADLEQYQLHPSLMDAAVGYTQLAGAGFYLPLAYEAIKIHAPLTRKLYSHARYRDDGDGRGDLLVCDLLLMDEEGNVLVEIEEYTLRRINSAAALGGESKAEPRPAEPAAGARPAESGSTSIITEGILPAEGAEVFGRILSSGLEVPRLAVATRDLRRMIEQSRAMTGSRILEQVNKLQSRQQRHPRPNLAVPYVEPRSETEQRLADIWREVLGVSEVGVDDNFFEMGGDSLLATLLIGRLGEAFNVDLSLRTIFDAPTVAEMAVAVVQKLAQEIDADTLARLLEAVKDLSQDEIQGAPDAAEQVSR
jgi:acyl transferase domain-containing protein